MRVLAHSLLIIFVLKLSSPVLCVAQPEADPAHGPIRFVDRTVEAGLHTFEHRLGDPKKRMIIDSMGSGVAVGDYDSDGDDDIYFVNGRSRYERPDPAWRNTLFRNEGGVFEDVTESAGVGDMGHGMCAVWGDVDGDGWLDLFVGNYGENVFFHNNSDGTFSDATSECGLQDGHYAASAAFADIDRDGDVDLFLGNYVEYNPETDGDLRAVYHGQNVFMGPMAFDSQWDILYANDGTGRFVNSSAQAGVNVSRGRAMGTAFFDIENDGNLDLYVTNDSTYNHVLRNQGDGVFEDLSYLSGGGFSDGGRGGASMGVSTGDYDNDGLLDLLITSYEQETDVLYRNEGDGNLMDVTASVGLFRATRRLVTWGSGFCDFDSDGLLDLYTVNGHVYPQVAALKDGPSYPQGVSIYRSTGRRFEALSPSALPADAMKRSGRGSALLDFDGDGDMDIVVNCMDSPPLLLENQSDHGNWLQIKLDGTSAQVFGTRVVATSGAEQWTRIVDGGSGYLSQNSQTLHFGFGAVEQLDEVTIYWPHHVPEVIVSPALNQPLVVKAPGR